jgi:hypothetical protein
MFSLDAVNDSLTRPKTKNIACIYVPDMNNSAADVFIFICNFHVLLSTALSPAGARVLCEDSQVLPSDAGR